MTSTKAVTLRPLRRTLLLALALCAVSLAVIGCGSSSNNTSSSGAASGSSGGSASSSSASAVSSSGGTGLKPVNPGELTVGMNLQFKPEMYLQAGKPAGYDVDLLNLLASSMKTKLNIQNLDFNGLIPGLQAHKFDLVSVGLTPTPAREQAVSFTRAYVPYAQILAVPAKAASSITSVSQLNAPGKTIVALQGSSDQQLASKLFPKATVTGFPDENAAFLQVATGRASAIVVEDYLLAEYQASNPGQLAEAALGKPLNVQYGSWAVPQGNARFVSYLNNWLCSRQKDGTLAKLYKKDFKVPRMPPMPPC